MDALSLTRDCREAPTARTFEGCLRAAPSPVKLRKRVGERVQAGLLKSPQIKILLLHQCVRVILQRCEDPHPNPLPGQGEGIQKVLAWQFYTSSLTLRTVFRQSLTRERVRVWVSGPLPDTRAGAEGKSGFS
jgi:hypothetical protein